MIFFLDRVENLGHFANFFFSFWNQLLFVLNVEHIPGADRRGSEFAKSGSADDRESILHNLCALKFHFWPAARFSECVVSRDVAAVFACMTRDLGGSFRTRDSHTCRERERAMTTMQCCVRRERHHHRRGTHQAPLFLPSTSAAVHLANRHPTQPCSSRRASGQSHIQHIHFHSN